jgi:hypothetical protein
MITEHLDRETLIKPLPVSRIPLRSKKHGAAMYRKPHTKILLFMVPARPLHPVFAKVGRPAYAPYMPRRIEVAHAGWTTYKSDGQPGPGIGSPFIFILSI